MAETPTILAQGETIYLNLPPGFPGRLSAVVAYLRQQLPGDAIDWNAVREAYLYGRGRPFPIASRNDETALAEKAKIRFSADRLAAYLVLYPPKPRGERLQEEDVASLVTAYGIPGHLVDPQAVRMALLRRSYNEPEQIACGRPAVDGNPASVLWEKGLPSDPEGFLAVMSGDSEYPETVLAEVEAGALVGRRTPPETGAPGLSVTGEATPARAGQDLVRLGEGLTLSPDSRGVVAVVGGHLRQHGGPEPGARVFPVLHVKDPQELREWSDSVFPGSVIVDGDLELTFPLRVLGDMEVRGGVIRSSLEVMGSLFVRDGVIQQRLSPLRVGGIVSAAFFERASVVAHTVHVRRYSLKSNLLALDRLVAPPRTSLKGGQIGCLGSVSVGVMGDRNSIPTELLVAHPSLLDTFRETFTEWADALTPEDEDSTDVTDAALLAEAARWREYAATLAQPDPLEAVVVAEAVNPGVSVRIGTAVREMQNTIGPVELRYERIGPRGRVSMSRL